MTPTWTSDCGSVVLYNADARDVLPGLAGKESIVTDPPWGVDQNSDNTRFPSINGSNREYPQILHDDEPFDPAPLLRFRKVALFGANCFSDRLPMGAWLIWCKRRDSMLGKFLADAEAIWINRGFGIYIKQHEWHGSLRASERGVKRQHPHQKPVAVMEWVLDRLKADDVCDPYMGSASTAIACLNTGRRFVGVEKNPDYFNIAKARIQKALAEKAELLVA
jgi:site-specific DNA-methyltransferase (adenine-specific)